LLDHKAFDRTLAEQYGGHCRIEDCWRPFAAVVGASAYALSATVLWAYSEGRVAVLVVIAVAPALIG